MRVLFNPILGITILILLLGGFSLIKESSGSVNELSNEIKNPDLIDSTLQIELVLTGLDFPTQFTFIDDDTILVAQKNDGKVIVIKNFEIQKNHALDLNVESSIERGLVGMSSTNFEDEDYVFIYFTESSFEYDTNVPGNEKQGNVNNGNKLIRYKWNGESLVDPKLILHPLTYANEHHSGGVMKIFDENIYLLIGDNQMPKSTLSNGDIPSTMDHGVILRVDFEGNPVPSNPFSEKSLEKYFAYGIRNGYGLDIDPLTNNVWETENGPANYDEINLVFPGFNSGWKKIIGPNGESFFSSDISDLNSFEGSMYSDPKFSWNQTVGVTAIEFLESKKLGEDYEYDAFVGDVRGKLYHFELNENRDELIFSEPMLQDLVAHTDKETENIVFGKNLGVITDIKTGPDGYLYILSMVKGVADFENWIHPLKVPEVVEQGQLMGVLFRIVPVQAEESENQEETEIITEIMPNEESEMVNAEEGGGCLIATAAFDSELSTQVQLLREIRDTKIMNTQVGKDFITGFNQFYYTFSPTVADMERQNPIFKEIVKITITPLLTSLLILNNINIDSDIEMLGTGIGIITMNIGFYFALPVIAILKLKRKL